MADGDPRMADPQILKLTMCTRRKDQLQFASSHWPAARTAVIVCDMWDSHHCHNAVRRVAELCPRMEKLLSVSRAKGCTIIHCPSECMSYYSGTRARLRAQQVPALDSYPEGIDEGCHKIPTEPGDRAQAAEAAGCVAGGYPIDQRDGGADDTAEDHAAWAIKLKAEGKNPGAPWTRQTDALTIDPEQDFVTDIGREVWSILHHKNLQHVLVLGVHTNMCVLGRPFGLRQLTRLGKEVALVRDMTDSMYNPASPPYVDHFTGNRLICEYIEKFVCPTTTSDQILEEEQGPFVFSGARPDPYSGLPVVH